MKTMFTALAISAMICTALATLVMIVFSLAGSANSTPQQFHSIKLWMGGLTLLSVIGVVAGIFLLRAGLSGWAAGVSFAPTIVMSIILVISLLK